MKKGDIVMIFGNPLKCEFPIDQARLIELITDGNELQKWKVEFLNDEGHFYNRFIKKL
jgi:hypothetical protein